MRKIQVYNVMRFEDGPRDIHAVRTPKDSKLLAVKALQDGLYAWFEIPAPDNLDQLHIVPNDNHNAESHFFVIATQGQLIKHNMEFIDILDIIAEGEEGEGQKVVIFPIYKLKDV